MAKRKPRPEVIPGSRLRIDGYDGRAGRPGFVGADLKRFTTLFTAAWNRLPPDDRRQILAHWRKRHPRRTPQVYVIRSDTGKDAEVMVRNDGYRLDFTDGVRSLPDAMVEDRVGWGLAVVWQFAVGLDRLFQLMGTIPGGPPDPEGALAGHAKAHMKDWGFDPRSLMSLGAVRRLEELEEEVRRKRIRRSDGAANRRQSRQR